GASDYIVKPFNGYEIAARVGAQIRAKRNYDEIKELGEQILRTKAALVESEKMAAVGSLAAGVAHEFNNLLFIMGGHMQLSSANPEPAQVRRTAEVVTELIGRGKGLVDELLLFSRSGEQEAFSSVDFGELLGQELALLRENLAAEKVVVDFSVSKVPPIRANRAQLSRVAMNLFLNAIEAMRGMENKKMGISLGPCSSHDCGCPCVPTRVSGVRCLELLVTDTGSGISAELRDKIFHPFMSTKAMRGGAKCVSSERGLGLFVSYGIVRRHGGKISFKSVPMKGTVFSVRLPMSGALCEHSSCEKNS
ncbi:MAG TPA: ATP-binding protein, partial [Elusimicrobiales bacterium]|nr:ATP-binding protein [Elusimicrobiales bacterium]